jgi:Domain of unknown function (DUF305)
MIYYLWSIIIYFIIYYLLFMKTEDETLTEKASDIAHSVADNAMDIADDVRERGGELAGQVGAAARSEMTELSQKAQAEYTATMKSPTKKARAIKIALFVGGIVLGLILASFGGHHRGYDRDDMKSSDMAMQMNHMNESLRGLSGAELEKQFLSDMVVHHQGAVDMAKAIISDAKNSTHPEIVTLATTILQAQTTEIAQMNNWLTSWYK